MSPKKACGPRRYTDEIKAKLALAVTRSRDRSTFAQLPTRAYYCPKCRGWHLSREKRKRVEQ